MSPAALLDAARRLYVEGAEDVLAAIETAGGGPPVGEPPNAVHIAEVAFSRALHPRGARAPVPAIAILAWEERRDRGEVAAAFERAVGFAGVGLREAVTP